MKLIGSTHKRLVPVEIILVLTLFLPVLRIQAQDIYTLERSLRTALQESRAIRDARLAVLTAEGQVVEARGNALPQITTSTSYSRNLSPLETFLPAIFLGDTSGGVVPIQIGSDNNWSTSVNVMQPLWNYQVIIGLRVAGRARQLQVESLRGVAQQTVTSTRKAFYGVLLAEESLRLNENSAERVREVLEETRALRTAGMVSEYDVLRLEVELGNLEPFARELRRPWIVPIQEFMEGKALCRMRLLGELEDLFGSPSSIMYRSAAIRQRGATCYKLDNPCTDTELCFELLRDGDYGFVHQVLTMTRRHGATETAVMRRSGVHSMGRTMIARDLGRFFLTDDEHRYAMALQLRYHDQFLARNPAKLLDSEFRRKTLDLYRSCEVRFNPLSILAWAARFGIRDFLSTVKRWKRSRIPG